MNRNTYISVKKLKMEQYKSGEEKQEEIKKYSLNSIIFYILIFIIIILCIWLYFFIKTESFNCMSNPLVYGVNHYKSSTGEDIVCRCNSPNNPVTMIVTKENITLDNLIT